MEGISIKKKKEKKNFLYRRHCKLLGFPLNKQKPLAEFTAEMAQSLIHAKGRPKKKSTEPLRKTGEV